MDKSIVHIKEEKKSIAEENIFCPKYRIIKNTRSAIVFVIIANTNIIFEQLEQLIFVEKIFPGTVFLMEDIAFINKINTNKNQLEIYEDFLHKITKTIKYHKSIITVIFSDKIFNNLQGFPASHFNNIYNIYFNEEINLFNKFYKKLSNSFISVIKRKTGKRLISDFYKSNIYFKIPDSRLQKSFLEKIIHSILSRKGINLPDKEKLPIQARQLYFLSSQCKNLNLDKIVFSPRGSRPENSIPLTLPFAWNSNPYDNKNWFAQLHMWRMLDDHILEYEKTGNPQWLHQVQAIMLDWHSFYESNAPKPAVWESMTVGLRAMKIAYLLALHYSGKVEFSEKFIKCCQKMARSHMDFILNSKNEHLFNHTLIDMHGAMALGWTLPPMLSQKIFNYVDGLLDKVLDAQFDSHGIHKEHSPYYHLFGITCLKRLINSGWFRKTRMETIIKKARMASPWFFMPDGSLAPIGDTPRNYPDCPVFDKKAELFAFSGYAIVRKSHGKHPINDSYLFFMGAYNSKVHKHQDDLSLIWYEGEDILCDSGKFPYGHSRERAYATSARAHNTLEIDGKAMRDFFDKSRKPWGNTINQAVQINDSFLISASISLPAINLTYRRHIFFLPKKFLIILDYIFSDQTHSYDFYWHFPANAQIEENNGKNMTLILDSRKEVYMSFSADLALRSEKINGRTKPQLQGFICDDRGRIVNADCLRLSIYGSQTTLCALFALDHELKFFKKSPNAYELYSAEKNYLIDIKEDNISIQ